MVLFLCYNFVSEVIFMKALTIRQHWASLIINGYKKYEFRSWKTNYRGKILIHSAIQIEKDMLDRFKNYDITCIEGAIIGEVNLVDCILVDKEFNDKLLKEDSIVYGKSNHVEKYAWKLDNVIKYEEPILCKGQLGLWNFEKGD